MFCAGRPPHAAVGYRYRRHGFSAEWTPTKTFTATLWREACPSDLGISFLYMRVNPSSPAPFICSSSFTATHRTPKSERCWSRNPERLRSTGVTTYRYQRRSSSKLGRSPTSTRKPPSRLSMTACTRTSRCPCPPQPGVVQAVEYTPATRNSTITSSAPIKQTSALSIRADSPVGRGRGIVSTSGPLSNPRPSTSVPLLHEAFAPRSSHFYTAIPDECAEVKRNPDWQYEKIAGFVALADLSGACSVGVKLYRVYNNGMSGAPNHRYTTDKATRDAMIQQGWVPEGYGPGRHCVRRRMSASIRQTRGI